MRFNFNSSWNKGFIGDLIEKTGRRAKNAELDYTAYSITNSDGFVVQADNWDGGSYVQASKEGYKIIHNGEIAYNPARINVGSIGYFDQNIGIISSLYVCLKPKKELISKYLFHFMKSRVFNKIVLKRQEGGVRDYFFFENLCGVKIIYPSIMEQEKIVSFLELINTRISTQKKIIEDLNRLKMSINSQASKQKGKIYKIKEVCTIGRGRVISNEEIKKQSNPIYPVFSSQTQNNGIMGYLDNYEFDGEYITWTTDGANAGTIFYHNEKFNCTNVCGTLKVNSQDILTKYLSFILPYYVKKYVSKNLANPKLMNNTMGNIEVNIISKIEQIKFINAVISIEKKLNNEKSILELYINQKEYLLNKLFI